MKYDPQKHHRRSARLNGYDYSQAGAYYFTIVAQQRVYLFGDVVDAAMVLNDAGKMLWAQWNALPERFPNVELDEFIVMPNHIHGVIVITDKTNVRRGDGSSSPSTLGDIVGAWKSITTDEYIKGVHQKNWQTFDRKVWQRNYWEHIIRDESELDRIREYIINNPAEWDNDEHNRKNAQSLGRCL